MKSAHVGRYLGLSLIGFLGAVGFSEQADSQIYCAPGPSFRACQQHAQERLQQQRQTQPHAPQPFVKRAVPPMPQPNMGMAHTTPQTVRRDLGTAVSNQAARTAGRAILIDTAKDVGAQGAAKALRFAPGGPVGGAIGTFFAAPGVAHAPGIGDPATLPKRR